MAFGAITIIIVNIHSIHSGNKLFCLLLTIKFKLILSESLSWNVSLTRASNKFRLLTKDLGKQKMKISLWPNNVCRTGSKIAIKFLQMSTGESDTKYRILCLIITFSKYSKYLQFAQNKIIRDFLFLAVELLKDRTSRRRSVAQWDGKIRRGSATFGN